MTPSTPGFTRGEWYLSYEAGGRPREQNHGIGGAEHNHLLADRPCAASSHGTSNPRLGRDAKAPNATAAVRDPGELGKSPARVVSLVQGGAFPGRQPGPRGHGPEQRSGPGSRLCRVPSWPGSRPAWVHANTPRAAASPDGSLNESLLLFTFSLPRHGLAFPTGVLMTTASTAGLDLASSPV